jgi:hypothetical protein
MLHKHIVMTPNTMYTDVMSQKANRYSVRLQYFPSDGL